MTLPQSNATLTKVTGGGGTEDWKTAAADGPAVWTGSYPAYFMEKRERVFGEGGADLLKRRVLIVETTLRDWTDGEIVHFTFNGQEQTAKVQMIEARSLAAAGPMATTTKLTLGEL